MSNSEEYDCLRTVEIRDFDKATQFLAQHVLPDSQMLSECIRDPILSDGFVWDKKKVLLAFLSSYIVNPAKPNQNSKSLLEECQQKYQKEIVGLLKKEDFQTISYDPLKRMNKIGFYLSVLAFVGPRRENPKVYSSN